MNNLNRYQISQIEYFSFFATEFSYNHMSAPPEHQGDNIHDDLVLDIFAGVPQKTLFYPPIIN